MASGENNKEIGRGLYLTEKTVKHYVTNILQKLQVRNRVEAALLAQKAARPAPKPWRAAPPPTGTDVDVSTSGAPP